MTIRPYSMLPALPDAGLLTRYLDALGVIVPLARTNQIVCPSFENGFTGTQGPSSLVGTTYALNNTNTTSAFGGTVPTSYHGARSVQISAGALVGIYWTFTPPAGVTAFSMKFLGAPGVRYELSVIEGGITIAITRFLGTGRWQWVSVLYTASGGSAQHQIARNDASSNADPCWVDGIQVESCADGINAPTTYIDGDQAGLVPNQYPPAYGWSGAVQASSSYRSAQTRAGGYIMRFRDFGFLITALIGLGLAPPQHEALTFAQLDGGQYQTTIKPPRPFTLAGRWAAASPDELDANIGRLARLLDRDLLALRQPLVLTTQALDCGGAVLGNAVTIPCLYSGGLEGNVQELPTAASPISFTQYIPYVVGPGQGAALTDVISVANANGILRRSPAGAWDALGTGAAGGTVVALAIGVGGKIYAAGDFTSMGGVASTSRIAYWDPVDSAWHAMGSGANDTVRALAVAPNGDIYAAGKFTLMGGVANTVRIARWDGALWHALSTGITTALSTVFALTIGPDGSVYATGDFTAPFTRITKWDGSAFSGLGTGLNNAGNALIVDRAGGVIVGGALTTANGVAASKIARWNGTTFTALAGGLNGSVLALGIDASGILYAGGIFTDTGYPNVAQWNGVAWSAVGSGLNGNVLSLLAAPLGVYAGGLFTASGARSFADHFALYNRSVWLAPDVDLPGTPSVTAIAQSGDGTIYIGFDTTGSASAAASTTVINTGTAEVAPRLVIHGPASSTSRVYSIANATTGQRIDFNLTLNPGEIATLTLDPTNISFISTFRGNILSAILPGSNESTFRLQPGTNVITFFAVGPQINIYLDWTIGYNHLSDALYASAP